MASFKNLRSRLKGLFEGSSELPDSSSQLPGSLELPERSQSGIVSDPSQSIGSFNIPVLIVSYFPVKQGRIDRQMTGDVGAPLDEIRRHTSQTTQQVIQSLEIGSTYHGYKDPNAQPSLVYRIVDSLEFLSPCSLTASPVTGCQ